MLEECEGCDWTRWTWCSVRDRLVSKGLIPPCLPGHTCGECEFYTHFCCKNAPGYLGGWKFTKPDTKACKRFVVSPPEPGDADATIRKLRTRVKHLSGEMNRLVGLLDAYADCPSYDDARQLVYNLRKELAEAKAEIARLDTECDRQATRRRKTDYEFVEAMADIDALQKRCDYLLKTRTSAYDARVVAERELAKAKVELLEQAKRLDRLYAENANLQISLNRRLNRLYVENGQLQISLTKAKAETERLRPFAENWQLVLGMRQHSSLRCIAPAIGYVPGYYSARTHLFGGSHTVFTSGSPTGALRAIQTSEEEE